MPPPSREELTTMERYYLEALRRWYRAYRTAPAIHELAHYCHRSSSPVYAALLSMEYKGYVRRNADRRFEVVR